MGGWVGVMVEGVAALGRPGMLLSAVFTAIVAAAVIWFLKRRRMVYLINKLPGPKCQPIVGNALSLNVDNLELFQKILGFCDYGEVVRLWLGFHPMVIISSARAAEVLLSSTHHIDKSDEYIFLQPWLGTGLITSTGSKWHSRRKMLTPAFHFRILEDFIDVFNKQTDKMVNKLKNNADGSLFNIFPYITLCALDIICETAMGRTINAQDDENSEYVKAIYKVVNMIQQRSFKVWQQPEFLYWAMGYSKEMQQNIKILHNMSRDTIRERRKLYDEEKRKNGENKEISEEEKLMGKKKNLAFLDLLLDASDGCRSLSDEDIREEVDTFMFAGHDTTAAAINWTLYVLGIHQDIQSRVHEEIDSILGDTDRPISMGDLREMKYLEMCMKEALRIYPSVPAIGRKLVEDIVVGDITVPAGATVMTMPYKIHRDPQQFPDPEKYDPDRFLPEIASKRHPYSFIPFSAGPRNCIGQKFALLEEKVVVSKILRKYKVESEIPRDKIEVVAELILRPKTGNFVKLFKRS